MQDTDRGVGLVDVLTAGAGGTVRGDFEIRFVDLDLDAVIKLGHDFDGSKRGLSSAGCVERRNADKAVNAVFALEVAVCVVAFDQDRCTLQTCFVAVQPVKQLDGEAGLFSPAVVHTVKHGRPVLCFGTAGTRMEGNDRIVVVVFAAQKDFDADTVFFLFDAFDLGEDFFADAFVFFFNAHFGEGNGILDVGFQLAEIFNGALARLDFL